MNPSFARLGFPFVVAGLCSIVACSESSDQTENTSQGGSTAQGGGSGVSGTGGSSVAGSTNTGGTGAPAGGVGGTGTSGNAGQTTGGVATGGAGGAGTQGGSAGDGSSGTGTGPGGADPGGAGPGGATTGGAGGASGAGMTGGAAGSLGGASVGGAGCGDSYVSGVAVTVHSEVRTILNVDWMQMVAADNVFLEFTFETGNVMTSRPKAGTTGMHHDVVLGAPGSTPVTVRVVSRKGGVDCKTRDYMQTTGAVPSGMPVPQVMTYNAAIASPDRWMFGAVENSAGGCNSTRCFYNATFWLYIIDRKGRVVWYYSDPASNATMSFQRVARDGEYIWIEKRPFGGSGTHAVLKRTLDGAYSEVINVTVSDCIDVTDDGSLLYDINNELRERTKAGQTRTIWSCRTQFGSGFECYTNTVNWNPRDNTVVMSYPEERTVVEVSRATGMLVGQYGAETGSYAFAATPAPPMPIQSPATGWEFGYQHFANITKDGTLMLSTHMPGYRTTDMPVAGQHAFEEYTIDRNARTLTMKWFFQAPGQEWAMYKGMAIKLPNNNVLANFGTGGIIREITQDKQTAFMVKFDAPQTTAQPNDFFNKMVGNNVLVNDLYALNGGGPR